MPLMEHLAEAGDPHQFEYVLEQFDIAALTNTFIFRHSSGAVPADTKDLAGIYPQQISIDHAFFIKSPGNPTFPTVGARIQAGALVLHCECSTAKKKLCVHQAQVLFLIMDRLEVRLFFDKKLRQDTIRKFAKDYGLEQERDLDDFFELEYREKNISIKPLAKELFPFNAETQVYFQENLLAGDASKLPATTAGEEGSKTVMVLGQHKYYKHLNIWLYDAPTGREGKIKNPLTALDITAKLWSAKELSEMRFFTGLSIFQETYIPHQAQDLPALKAIVANPLGLEIYCKTGDAAGAVSTNSLTPVKMVELKGGLALQVNHKDQFYEIEGYLEIDEMPYSFQQITLRYGYFIPICDVLYLVDNPHFLQVIEFFKKHHHKIVMHQSKFEAFRQNVLGPLENKVRISYAFLKPATQVQLEESGFHEPPERIIYLSDEGGFVSVLPVMRYGKVEVPLLSRRQLYAVDSSGNPFVVERDTEFEYRFMGILLRQHADFEDQMELGESFYLHKNRFLTDDWFLEAFEEWQNQNITVLGFSSLNKKRLNPHRAKVSITVSNGADWFDTSVDVRFGNQKLSLKHLQTAVRNKSKYVRLGDGSFGILPADWVEKMARYFEAGDLMEDILRTPRAGFANIAALYDEEMFLPDAKERLGAYQSAIDNFESIQAVDLPDGLQGSLRAYQKEGLDWLCFLDRFGFGGCLADDMGLGKTIQVIAFLLSQRETAAQNTNLIVVPTSLIFNWQAELAKFAPSLRLHTFYGQEKMEGIEGFDSFEIILTTYGTLLSDILLLKKCRFNYIVLDESQNIKNPTSQRYQAACLLQSRNRLVLTGTPLENNTMDLYGQLSFASPGLLGSLQLFKDLYAIPIDKFADSKRALELQKKIAPFILRRTKQQVATELPDKSEMVFYCEMGEAQRRVYDACKKHYQDFLLSHQDEELPKQTIHILQGLTKLRQVCNAPSLLKNEEFYTSESAKIEVLMEEIRSKAPEHRILVFSQFVGMLELIRTALVKTGIGFEWLTGQTKDRAAKVHAFQNDETVRVFLISLKAGGTGLNLTGADYVYLVDPWWNPAVENQAIDRCYRIGQHKNVMAVRLICPNTIEEKIMKLQASKRELASGLIKTDAGILKSFSKKDLVALFS